MFEPIFYYVIGKQLHNYKVAAYKLVIARNSCEMAASAYIGLGGLRKNSKLVQLVKLQGKH